MDQMTTFQCTPFCEKLKKLELRQGGLPPHSELKEHFKPVVEDLEKGYELGRRSDLLQRKQCNFCQLVLTAINQNAGQQNKDDQSFGVLLFPSEQCFRLSYPSRLSARLAFVADEATVSCGRDNARVIGQDDWTSLIENWLDLCVKNHPECSLESVNSDALENRLLFSFHESATSNFRLIDLERGCIMHAALDERYIALSYVWGNPPILMLNTENYDDLLVQGSLDSIRSRLPKTINDVLEFVKSLGERYLWIDGLCLVQDDHEDVTLGIQMMNSIYHGAYCTIVAASGNDANAGLNPGHGNAQLVKEVAPGLNMTVLHNMDWHSRRSQYNTRGWTLQELVLSRRTIVFIDGQIHFRCRSATWRSDTWAEKWLYWQDPDDSKITRIPGLLDGLLTHLWPYQKLVEEYSRRKLRRNGDALRATAGIIRSLAAGMNSHLIEGLPAYYLNHFLLFISSDGDFQRRPEFASFSWAGWSGRIMWPRENFAWYDEQNERTWEVANILKYFKHNRIVQYSSINSKASSWSLSSCPYRWNDRDIPSMLLRIMQEHPDTFADTTTDPERTNDDPRFFSSSGSNADLPNWDRNQENDVPRPAKRAFSIKAYNMLNGQAEFDRMIQHVEDGYDLLESRGWQCVRSYHVDEAKSQRSKYGPRPMKNSGDAAQFEFREAPDDRRKRQKRVDERRVWAEKKMPEDQVPNFPPYDILQFKTITFHLKLGASSNRVRERTSSFDRVPGVPLFGSNDKLVGSLHPDNFNSLEKAGSSVELLVITNCFEPTVSSALSDLENPGPLPWRMFWVLYIVWKQGIADRRGVGQVLASALENSVGGKPQVKQIVLG